MPLDLPISAVARQELAGRVPTDIYNLATGQIQPKTIDGTDVHGMIQPVLSAVEKLEILVRELQVQVAGLESERGRAK